ACRTVGVPCIVFGGRVEPGSPAALYELGATAVVSLSGRPERARDDLADLGEALGRLLVALAASRPS
ncbi:MAG: hypothetical protein M3271_11300, partial [Actinomycetota bacterium]|nr:hypothetical protein [Actinomycetota bacterium]